MQGKVSLRVVPLDKQALTFFWGQQGHTSYLLVWLSNNSLKKHTQVLDETSYCALLKEVRIVRRFAQQTPLTAGDVDFQIKLGSCIFYVNYRGRWSGHAW